MNDLDVIALGREADRLNRDPAFRAAVERAEHLILRDWAATHASEISRREEFHADWRALQRLKTALSTIATDGTAQITASAVRRLRT